MRPGDTRLHRGGGHWLAVIGASAGGALAVALVLASPATPALFGRVLLRALVYALVIGALAGALVPPVVRRLVPERSATRWLLLTAMLVGMAVVGTALASALVGLLGLGAPHETYGERFPADLRIVVLLSLVIGVGLSVLGMLRARLATATVELRTRELEQERMRKLALEARLASLEARLSPHFLFNTLNAVAALVHDDPDRAERTIERLAGLLRFSLDAAHRGTVPLAEEVRIVGDYLEIEKARFAERLDYSLAVDPAVEAWAVPPLCLQVLVENSVKHAVPPRPGGGRISVEARARGDRLRLRVWDDGPGFSLAAAPAGHGLENLRARLAARHGERATLAVERCDGGTAVTLELPASAAAEPAAV